MGGVPPLALRTDLKLKVYGKREPASAGYVQFLSKDRELTPADRRGSGGGIKIRWLAAFHGYLPLLQPLAKSLRKTSSLGNIAMYAGKSHYHILSIIIVFLSFVSASDFFFSLSRSARRSAGDLAVAKIPEEV